MTVKRTWPTSTNKHFFSRGNPLERDPQLVAKEARRGLIEDTSRYGVVLTAKNEVDITATEVLRATMRPAQEKLASNLFNRGGTLKAIRDKCLQETGLAPPVPPSSKVLTGPAAQLQHVRDLHARRVAEDAEIYGPAKAQTETLVG